MKTTTQFAGIDNQLLLFTPPSSFNRSFECVVEALSVYDRRSKPVVIVLLKVTEGEHGGRTILVETPVTGDLIRSLHDALGRLTPSFCDQRLIGRRVRVHVLVSGTRPYDRGVRFSRCESKGERGMKQTGYIL